MKQFFDSRQHIEARVNDRMVNGVLVGQMARFVELMRRKADDAQGSFRIVVTVIMHELIEGQLGLALTGPDYTPYPVILRGDNDTIRNADFSIHAMREHPLQTKEQWEAICAGAPDDAFLEGDYFDYVSKTDPIVLDDLILQHMQAAQLMGRYL